MAPNMTLLTLRPDRPRLAVSDFTKGRALLCVFHSSYGHLVGGRRGRCNGGWHLESGRLVILDRSLASTLAHDGPALNRNLAFRLGQWTSHRPSHSLKVTMHNICRWPSGQEYHLTFMLQSTVPWAKPRCHDKRLIAATPYCPPRSRSTRCSVDSFWML
jgi:hypothetical protein